MRKKLTKICILCPFVEKIESEKTYHLLFAEQFSIKLHSFYKSRDAISQAPSRFSQALFNFLRVRSAVSQVSRTA